MVVSSNEELGKAIKSGANTIEIEAGSSAEKTYVKIKATGKVAWAVCFSALSVALAVVVVGKIAVLPTAGVSAVAGLAAGTAGAAPAIALLGLTAVKGAIIIAFFGGGIGALTKLRGYKMETVDGKIFLIK
ncbi:MAG: adhesin [Chitinispirillia bacterium]|nr:adhesin [Chitinispirillia bacterium]